METGSSLMNVAAPLPPPLTHSTPLTTPQAATVEIGSSLMNVATGGDKAKGGEPSGVLAQPAVKAVGGVGMEILRVRRCGAWGQGEGRASGCVCLGQGRRRRRPLPPAARGGPHDAARAL